MSDPTNQTEYRGPEILTPLGDQLQLALGLEKRPETFGDWVDALAFFADRDDIDVDMDMLFTIDESPHRATVGPSTTSASQDPIIVPFLDEDVDTVEIETESPVSGETIELTVTETEIKATPSDVVMKQSREGSMRSCRTRNCSNSMSTC